MYLFHDKDKVAKITFATPTIIDEVEEIYIPELMPCKDVFPAFQKVSMQRWLMSRTISFSRQDVKNIKDFYGTDILTSEAKMSLLDKYYFTDKPEPDNDILNFTYKEDSDIFHTLLFSPECFTEEPLDDTTPNYAFPGMSCRYWHNSKDGLFLLNQNAKFDMGFQIAEDSLKTGVVLPRKYMIHESFIHTAIDYKDLKVDADTEAIPFWCYFGSVTKDVPKRERLKEIFESTMPNYMEFINKMNDVDELLGYDRPIENLYVLRNNKDLTIKEFMRI